MNRIHLMVIVVLSLIATAAWWSSRPVNRPITTESPLTAGQIKAASISAGFTTTQSASLESLATEAIRVYSSGTWEDFFNLRALQGLPVDEEMRKLSKTLSWDEMTAVLRGVEISKPQIRHAVIKGSMQNESPTMGRMMTVMAGGMNPARGEKDITDVSKVGADVVEVSFPARMRANNEQGEIRFAGQFCILFAKRPSESDWIIIGLRIRNLPPAKVILPPI